MPSEVTHTNVRVGRLYLYLVCQIESTDLAAGSFYLEAVRRVRAVATFNPKPDRQEA